jgi:hypothetical protein
VSIIGIDSGSSGSVYFQSVDPNDSVSRVYKVDKTGVNGARGSALATGTTSGSFVSMIGNTFFLADRGGPSMCTTASCVDLSSFTNSTNYFIPFKSPSPQYFAQFDDGVSYFEFSWWTMSKTNPRTYLDVPLQDWNAPSYFAAGDRVFWVLTLADSTTTLYSASATGSTARSTWAGGMSAYLLVDIIDVSAQSILLQGSASDGSSRLLRVPMPTGKGNSSPDVLATIVSSSGFAAAEDSSGVYWIDGGTMYRCQPATCTGTPLALGLQPNGYLYIDQGTSALYWGDGGNVMRLAK